MQIYANELTSENWKLRKKHRAEMVNKWKKQMRAKDKQSELKTTKTFLSDGNWLILCKLFFKTFGVHVFGSQLFQGQDRFIKRGMNQYHDHVAKNNLESCIWMKIASAPNQKVDLKLIQL